jgi:hypothetical protein
MRIQKFIGVALRLDEQSMKLVKRRAEESNMNLSEYIRHCVLLESMIDGDVESFKLIAEKMKEKLRVAVGKLTGI